VVKRFDRESCTDASSLAAAVGQCHDLIIAITLFNQQLQQQQQMVYILCSTSSGSFTAASIVMDVVYASADLTEGAGPLAAAVGEPGSVMKLPLHAKFLFSSCSSRIW
jgi:hypothetical protein